MWYSLHSDLRVIYCSFLLQLRAMRGQNCKRNTRGNSVHSGTDYAFPTLVPDFFQSHSKSKLHRYSVRVLSIAVGLYSWSWVRTLFTECYTNDFGTSGRCGEYPEHDLRNCDLRAAQTQVQTSDANIVL
jgi:hypothetical protein